MIDLLSLVSGVPILSQRYNQHQDLNDSLTELRSSYLNRMQMSHFHTNPNSYGTVAGTRLGFGTRNFVPGDKQKTIGWDSGGYFSISCWSGRLLRLPPKVQDIANTR